MGRIAGRFTRVEPRLPAGRFVLRLLADLPRKNCWTIVEWAGETTPHGMQHLFYRAVWNADAVRDDVRECIVEHLHDEAAVLVVDDDLRRHPARASPDPRPRRRQPHHRRRRRLPRQRHERVPPRGGHACVAPRTGDAAGPHRHGSATQTRSPACRTGCLLRDRPSRPSQPCTTRSLTSKVAGGSCPARTRRSQRRSTSARCRTKPSSESVDGSTDRRDNSGPRPEHFNCSVARWALRASMSIRRSSPVVGPVNRRALSAPPNSSALLVGSLKSALQFAPARAAVTATVAYLMVKPPPVVSGRRRAPAVRTLLHFPSRRTSPCCSAGAAGEPGCAGATRPRR